MWRVLVAVGSLSATLALAQDAGLDVPVAAPDGGTATVALEPTVELKQPPPERSFYRDNFHGTAVMTGMPFVYEVSFIAGGGGYVHLPGVPTVPLTGIRVREYNGLASFALVALLGNLIQGLQALPTVSNVKQTSDTNRIYNSNGTATDVTTTTTTANVTPGKDPAKIEREQAELRAGLAGITWLELAVYGDNFLGWNRGVPGGSGYELAAGGHGNLFFIGDMPVVLDVGLQLANIRVPAPVGSGVSDQYLYWASGGIVGRLRVPLARVASVDAEWVLNFLSFDYLRPDDELRAEGRVVSSPFKLGVEVYATDRVVLRAQGVLGGFGFTDGKLGLYLSAGVRL